MQLFKSSNVDYSDLFGQPAHAGDSDFDPLVEHFCCP